MWILEVLKDMAKPSTLLNALGNALSFLIGVGLLIYAVFLVVTLSEFLK